jgi:hypothetical protein
MKNFLRSSALVIASICAAVAIGCAATPGVTGFQQAVTTARTAVAGVEAVSAALFAAGEITANQNAVVQKNGALIITMLDIAVGLYPTDPVAAQAQLDDAQTQITSIQTKNAKLHTAAVKRGVAKP